MFHVCVVVHKSKQWFHTCLANFFVMIYDTRLFPMSELLVDRYNPNTSCSHAYCRSNYLSPNHDKRAFNLTHLL